MKVFDYGDIQLVPNKCVVNSRSECDTMVTLGKHTFKMPVVPANMQTITDETIAEFLAENGYFYIMHRFNEVTRIPLIRKMRRRGLITLISASVKKEEYLLIEKLAEESLNPDYITIDIAHGHASSVIDMIRHIKKCLSEAFVIAGNAGTPETVRELENAGADTTKVGVGPGKVYIAKIRTGLRTGGWQLAALRWCVRAARKPIIADGGIKTHGDIAESVCSGAAMVMIGSSFTGHEGSPDETKVGNGIVYKKHFGSASEFQKGEKRNIEGEGIWVQHKGSLKDTLVEMQQDPQSSISYARERGLESIRKTDYVVVKNLIFNGDTV